MSPLAARHLRLVSIGLAGAAGVAGGADVGGPFQAVTVLAFLLLGPGLAVTPLLRIEHGIGQVAAAIGLSLTTLIVVSEVLVYAQVSSAGWGLALIAGATLVSAVPPLVRDRR